MTCVIKVCRRGHIWNASERFQCGECKRILEKTRRHRSRRQEQAPLAPERNDAWRAVENAKATGQLLHPSSLPCVDCGQPAREYDHHLGYAPEHRLDVQAVCRPCHVKRSWPTVSAPDGTTRKSLATHPHR